MEMILGFSLIILQFFLVQAKQQYLQCSHLNGGKTVAENQVFGETGKYSPENTMGGVSRSISFAINKKTEILVCFGKGVFFSYVDFIWKFSINKKEWMFLKGRKNEGGSFDMYPFFSNNHQFSEDNQIGARCDVNGWIDEEEKIITFFGGYGIIQTSVSKDMNELWRYNISSNSYAVIRYNYYNSQVDNNLDGYLHDDKKKQYHELNIPYGRKNHEMIKLNENEVLLVGGSGRLENDSSDRDFSDWWIISTKTLQWKLMGGSLTEKETPTLGDHDVYHKDNMMGSFSYTKAQKINEEEVLFFGGKEAYGTTTINSRFSNYVFKYNISSNMFKCVSGYNNYDGKGFKREYDKDNLPSARQGHIIRKINDEEISLFGGYGTNGGTSYFNDQFLFNFKTNLWKFIGTEASIYGDRVMDVSNSKDMKIGSIAHFSGEYLDNRFIILNGNGFSPFERGYLNDVWIIYYGKRCNFIDDIDPTVCNSRGNCTDFNYCQCEEGYFGNDCELTKCNGILSNETEEVCSQNGICVDSHCLCFEQSPYNNIDCTINENLKSLIDNLWIYIAVPIGITVALIVIIFIVSISIFLFLKLRKTTKKFEGIEDVDLILQEAKLEQKSKNPKIKINKELFEINFEDIKLKSIIGDGASLSCIFLVEWKSNFCAYKRFRIENGTNSDGVCFEEFEKEVKIYSSIHHPSILQFYGATVNLPNVGIVLEYCRKGDLNSFLNKYKFENKKSYHDKLRILKEIASGMDYLHGINVLHRDLKPENVLIDDNEHSKIMDFGLSKLTVNSEKTLTKTIGTSYYMAPEVFKGNQYSNKCDIFSFAILCYVVITENFFPYGNKDNQFLIMKKVSNTPNFRPKIDPKEFKGYKFLINFILKNWKEDPNERNSFKEIVEIFKKEEEKMIPKNKKKVEIKKTKKEKRIAQLSKIIIKQGEENNILAMKTSIRELMSYKNIKVVFQ